MNLESHIEQLASKHTKIQTDIDHEKLRPQPDQILISRLKKQKLLLKEEISRLNQDVA